MAKRHGDERAAIATGLIDRMAAAGISDDDILDFYGWAEHCTLEQLRTKIDEAEEFHIHGFPGIGADGLSSSTVSVMLRCGYIELAVTRLRISPTPRNSRGLRPIPLRDARPVPGSILC